MILVFHEYCVLRLCSYTTFHCTKIVTFRQIAKFYVSKKSSLSLLLSRVKIYPKICMIENSIVTLQRKSRNACPLKWRFSVEA